MFHGLVRMLLGVALLVNEAIVREEAQIDVLAAGLSLLVLPEAVRFDRWMARLRALAVEAVADTDEDQSAP